MDRIEYAYQWEGQAQVLDRTPKWKKSGIGSRGKMITTATNILNEVRKRKCFHITVTQETGTSAK